MITEMVKQHGNKYASYASYGQDHGVEVAGYPTQGIRQQVLGLPIFYCLDVVIKLLIKPLFIYSIGRNVSL